MGDVDVDVDVCVFESWGCRRCGALREKPAQNSHLALPSLLPTHSQPILIIYPNIPHSPSLSTLEQHSHLHNPLPPLLIPPSPGISDKATLADVEAELQMLEEQEPSWELPPELTEYR